jgi:hypothetical protein
MNIVFHGWGNFDRLSFMWALSSLGKVTVKCRHYYEFCFLNSVADNLFFKLRSEFKELHKEVHPSILPANLGYV